jgi:ElaB/YqjD/DUF883 family membrane-anchored ribosome-binding protein
MNKQTQATGKDLCSLAEYSGSPMDAAADATEQKLEQARNRLDGVMERANEIYGRVREKAADYAKATHQAVQERPYHGIGIAFAIGALLGYLITSSRSSGAD